MDIGEVERVIRVAPEPFPMGEPQKAPKELPVPEVEPVPA
jgi:hypothetical protein